MSLEGSMKVFLVRPDSLMPSKTVPLGMGYLAQAVRNAGHEVHILDGRLHRLSAEEASSKVLSEKPDVIGISAIHYESEGALELIEALRNAGFCGPLILGGALVTTEGDKFVEQGLVDAAIEGEGEVSLVSYLDSLAGKISNREVPGLIYMDNGSLHRNPPEIIDSIVDLKPAWDLIDPEQYFNAKGRNTHGMLARTRKSVMLFTSRGCPYGCIYCHNVFGKRFRAHSPEAVLEELEMLIKDYGLEGFEIADDVFNFDPERAKRIAQLIIERGLKLSISFSNAVRADRMDEELIDLLHRAGTYRINYAVETASPRLQKMLKKNLDLDKTMQVIEWTADRGMFTYGCFMMGFPTETEADVKMTVDYALRSKLHSASFFYLNPFPNTEITRLFPLSEERKKALTGMDYYTLSLNMSEVDDETLKKMNRQAYRKLHWHPKRMWRTFKVVPKNWNTVRSVAIMAVLSITDLHHF